MKRSVIILILIIGVFKQAVAIGDAMPDTVMLEEIGVSAIKQGVSNA